MRAHGRLAVVGFIWLVGCDGGVQSSDDARRAYLGLDVHIDKAITLGFAGFNAASSANIPTQMTTGAAKGTLQVTGQVDQGASNNKGMRLSETLTGYSDDGKLIYATDPATAPALGLSLKGIPTGTLSGSLTGNFAMTGDLEGAVMLSVTFTGDLQAGAGNTVERKAGSTHIVGTANSPAGSYAIDVTR
jgi:hypothetical protein